MIHFHQSRRNVVLGIQNASHEGIKVSFLYVIQIAFSSGTQSVFQWEIKILFSQGSVNILPLGDMEYLLLGVTDLLLLGEIEHFRRGEESFRSRGDTDRRLFGDGDWMGDLRLAASDLRPLWNSLESELLLLLLLLELLDSLLVLYDRQRMQNQSSCITKINKAGFNV